MPLRDRRRGRGAAIGVVVAAGVLLLAFANAHLVYVAVTSQPECVPHLAADGAPGSFKAAKPAC